MADEPKCWSCGHSDRRFVFAAIRQPKPDDPTAEHGYFAWLCDACSLMRFIEGTASPADPDAWVGPYDDPRFPAS